MTHGGEGPDYSVPGVRERHHEAMRRVSQDPAWKAKLHAGITRRDADPAYHDTHLVGIRASVEIRRSKTCTLCDVLLTKENSHRRSWCDACKKEYHRKYNQTHKRVNSNA